MQKAADLKGDYLQELATSLPLALAGRLVPQTTADYASVVERWTRSAEEHDVQSYPANAFHLALYLVHLMRTVRTLAPVVKVVYGVSWAHETVGWQDPSMRSAASAERKEASC